MVQYDQEPTPQPDIGQVLGRIRQGQLLQFMPDTVRLYKYVETGETDMRSVDVGESSFILSFPVKHPVLQTEVPTLDDLFEPEGDDNRYDEHVADEIDSKEYETWKESLASPDDVKAAAVSELSEREIDSDDETIPCVSCKGQMQFEVNCECRHGGTAFVDIPENSAPAIMQRPDEVPDPDCNTCEGTGKRMAECSYCEGCGLSAKYPQIILKNEVTGEERVLKLDLAALILSGDVQVEWGGHEKVYPGDFEAGEKMISFNVSDYIDRAIAEMGIDKDNAARVIGDSIGKIGSEQSNVSGGHAFWRKKDGEITAGFIQGQENMTAVDVLKEAQRNLSYAHAWLPGKIKDKKNGVVVAKEWVMRPLRPIEDTLEDLKTALIKEGYTLGFKQSLNVATGETQPAFYILDKNGKIQRQLNKDYYLRESLENAWLAFQKLRSQT